MNCDAQLTGNRLYQMHCSRCRCFVLSKYDNPSKRFNECRSGGRCQLTATGIVFYEMRCQRPECRRLFISRYSDPKLRKHLCTVRSAPRSKQMAARAWSLAEATAKWVAAGSPVRGAEEISTLYELCAACPKFTPHKTDATKGSCNLCGCRLRKAGGVLNKIKMATEHCPLGKW